MFFLNISIQRKHGIRQEKVCFYYFISFVTLYLLEGPWESSFSRRGGNKTVESSLNSGFPPGSKKTECMLSASADPWFAGSWQDAALTRGWVFNPERGQDSHILMMEQSVLNSHTVQAFFFHNLITLNCSFPGCLGCIHKWADVSADCLISNLQLAPKEQPAHCG